jgi:diguanylate cyclase (GGDEF)-like protein
MNNPTWLNPNPSDPAPGRAWRLDAPESPAASNENSDVTKPRSRSTQVDASSATPEADVFRNWISARFDGLLGCVSRFEDVLHRFAAIIATVDDPAIVESALFRLAHQIAPGCWIELIADESAVSVHAVDAEAKGAGQATDRSAALRGQGVVDVPLRSGASTYGRLRLRSRPGGRRTLRNRSIERLTTLCTMAASAMECLGNHTEWTSGAVAVDQTAAPADRPMAKCGQTSLPGHPSTVIHDATYLNAVLPFALNQSRRHREPLSILCVAIDRQRGLMELLGRAELNRIIRHVGEIVIRLLRASDIVARLDDDRMVAVLPRAPRGGALRVAEKICQAVAEMPPAGCSHSGPTVSIGVATFPSCAGDVYALFDAADEALAQAQHRGRNQAVLAPACAPPSPAHAPAPAASCTH